MGTIRVTVEIPTPITVRELPNRPGKANRIKRRVYETALARATYSRVSAETRAAVVERGRHEGQGYWTARTEDARRVDWQLACWRFESLPYFDEMDRLQKRALYGHAHDKRAHIQTGPISGPVGYLP